MYTVDPLRMFEVKQDVCPLKVGIEVSGLIGNKTLANAVTGKRHRVMGWIAQGGTAASGAFAITSNLGGALLTAYKNVPGNGAGLDDFKPIVEPGYCETFTGEALCLTITAAPVNFTVFYITYTP